jgi:dihydroxy-acid dehydratase
MPGCAIAAFRMNRPTVIIYGGTIQAGVRHVDCPALGFKKGDPVNIGEAFESYGVWLTGPHALERNPKLIEPRCVCHRKDFR